ncbi:MAG: XRE family transcriptional regulator, partial [Alphaproteobacteria bacterium]|nr:XRE family transcriptional regulator [Alphaproteobacteria bacterium]
MATRAKWIITLEKLMDAQGVTPRSLSLQAGLNETAVRDILMGRAKFPRYDTLKSIADVLGTTPAFLMGDDKTKTDLAKGKIPDPAQLELLTEIIARASEVNG